MLNNIIFDIDGTIVDTKSGTIETLNRVLFEEFGYEFPTEDLEKIIGIPGRIAMKKLGVKDPEQCNKRWNQYFYSSAGALKLFDGIKQAIEDLSRTEFKLGIVTSKDSNELKKGFYGCGIDRYFNMVVCFNDTENHKPHPDPILTYLKRTGADPSRTVYIGDTVYDKECAHKSGVKFALAGWGSVNVPHDGCDYILNRPEDILLLSNK